eukprot:SAG22_NODE_16672_length_320_cov_0.927602_1_plen_41_part_10
MDVPKNQLPGKERTTIKLMDFFGIFDDPGTERYRRDQEDVD